jgi:hypothetical protein
VVSSAANERLRTACDFTFRTVLAKQVIVEGKKSLGLLQGLLIYLAWHYQYLRHQTQQIYQYLQLAIGMVVDLGLDTPKPRQRILPSLLHSAHGPERTSADGLTAEEERALRGCYSLSCGLAVLVFDKPQNLHRAPVTVWPGSGQTRLLCTRQGLATECKAATYC